jgi:two-component system, NtrC family, nitrogen regulation sensor histidine kinase NtrY
MNRLQHKLILIFLAATLIPLAAILWFSMALVDFSLNIVPADELDRLSKSFETVAREFYRQSREDLKDAVASGRLEPQRFSSGSKAGWPGELQQFWDSRESERFGLSEPDGNRLQYMVRHESELWLYSKNLNGIQMEKVTQQYRQARTWVSLIRDYNRYKGPLILLLLISAVVWTLSLASMIYLATRISRPIRELTAGLFELANGNFEMRLESKQHDEIGRAIRAFNQTASDLRQSRERLIYLTQIASWQMLARKMAHELKNSLTPIRLTVEEIMARQQTSDRKFLDQAAQVVIEEVEGLERRIRAFSEFATEPVAAPTVLDLNALLRERIPFLSVAHPEVTYEIKPSADLPPAWADSDQIKGILTNLLENAAEAAGAGGRVWATTGTADGKIVVEVHDSGPGLSAEAQRTLFEPSISFKRLGMGLGLSISRKNALMAGGDLQSITGILGGAGFRLLLPMAREQG